MRRHKTSAMKRTPPRRDPIMMPAVVSGEREEESPEMVTVGVAVTVTTTVGIVGKIQLERPQLRKEEKKRRLTWNILKRGVHVWFVEGLGVRVRLCWALSWRAAFFAPRTQLPSKETSKL